MPGSGVCFPSVSMTTASAVCPDARRAVPTLFTVPDTPE